MLDVKANPPLNLKPRTLNHTLVKVASIIFNYALGFSALHTLVVNCTLLPPALRPRWGMRIALGCTALFFTVVAGIATVQHLNR